MNEYVFVICIISPANEKTDNSECLFLMDIHVQLKTTCDHSELLFLFHVWYIILRVTWMAQWSLQSRLVWTRHHLIIEEKHGLMNPFDVCLPLRCLCCPISWRLKGSISWLLTSARCSSSSCCCTWWWTASSFCDILDEYSCSDVRFPDNCWACSTNFSSDTIDENSFH